VLTYILLLILLWAFLRFIARFYRYMNEPASRFTSSKTDSVENKSGDRNRSRDIEDAEFEILPKENNEQPE